MRFLKHVLGDKRQYVMWRWGTAQGRRTKIPFQINGRAASTMDPSTWSLYGECLHALNTGRFDGVGYVFRRDPDEHFNFIGVDLDSCIVNGKLLDWAESIVSRLNTYTEISPSGTGVKLFGRSSRRWSRQTAIKFDYPIDQSKRPGIEVYQDKRYFCLTGQSLNVASTASDITEHLAWLADTFGFRQVKGRSDQPTGSAISRPMVAERGSPQAKYRGAAYLARMEPCISGHGGHNRLYRATCKLREFGCTRDEALELLTEFNSRCEPPWSLEELTHKITSVWNRDTPSEEV